MPVLKYPRGCTVCDRRMEIDEAYSFVRQTKFAICRRCWPEKGGPTLEAWAMVASEIGETATRAQLGPKPGAAQEAPAAPPPASPPPAAAPAQLAPRQAAPGVRKRRANAAQEAPAAPPPASPPPAAAPAQLAPRQAAPAAAPAYSGPGPIAANHGQLVRFPCGCEVLSPPYPTNGATLFVCCRFHVSVTVSTARL